MIVLVATVAIAPALAQRGRGFRFNNDRVIENEINQEAESGDFQAETEIALSGDNSNQCAPVLQVGNTGNNQNAQSLTQY